ncbi:MAG TPA: DUF4143 domain-containing protein, partial [Planctomycetota bacterium]|nr:DUF4143 domain-containing protein [Planctomycetota bacterium]
ERALRVSDGDLGRATLEPLLAGYLRSGGFPEYLAADPADRDGYFWRTVVERVLFRDLPSLVGEIDRRVISKALLHAAHETGRLVNFASLASDWGVTRATVGNYFRHLETANLVRPLPRFARTAEARARGALKVFAVDPGLSLDLRRESGAVPLRGEVLGAIAETTVHGQILRLGAKAVYHWRDRDREVDLVIETPSALVAVEVRAGKEAGDLRGLEAFAREFRGVVPVVLYNGPLERRGARLFVPFRLFFS